MADSKNFSHIKPALAHGKNVSLQYALQGEPVVKTGRSNSAGENIQPAGLWSTAPYVPPKPRVEPVPNIRQVKRPCSGKDGECKAHAVHGLDYCIFHARQLGIYDAWLKDGESSTPPN